MNYLKNHPFAVAAHFKRSLVLTFAAPREQLQHLIPECLTLDTYDNQWAFLAIAMVQTEALRPAGFPKFLGRDFFLIGYRLFVRYQNKQGKNLRGLYILKSETDSPFMTFFGNVFTHYQYLTTDITQTETATHYQVASQKSGFSLSAHLVTEDVLLPQESPFPDWTIARRYAGPLPHTFTYNPDDKTVLTIRGLRDNWKPQPIKIDQYQFQFLQELNIPGLALANAFMVENIPYRWDKGKVEKWQH